MNKNFVMLITSLACFTLGSGGLLEATPLYYVTKDTQNSADPSSDCADCLIDGNTCCQFLDACYDAAVGGVQAIIYLTPPAITYIEGITFDTNDTAFATLSSTNSLGTVINFNGQGSIGGYIFNPTYQDVDHPGNFTLDNVVFQNANGSPISIAGGSVTINGTSTTGGSSFSGNTWEAGFYNSHQPSLIFGNSGDYSVSFPDSITYNGPDTILALTNNNTSVNALNLSGNISKGSFTGELDITSAGALYLTGTVTMSTVVVHSGTVYLFPTSGTSAIGTLDIDSNAFVNSNNSVGSSTIINIGSSGTLSFGASFPSSSPFLSGGTINLNTNCLIDDRGNSVTIDSLITGGAYTKVGGGIQTLTNTSNSYTGPTLINGGVLSISNIAQINNGGTEGIRLNTGGCFFASSYLTIPGGITIQVNENGGLAAGGGQTLTVEAPLTTAGVETRSLIIGSSIASNASGTVSLQGSGSSFSGPVVIGAVTSSASFPATLSLSNLDYIGTPTSWTLQGQSTFNASGITSIAAPIYLNVLGTISGDQSWEYLVVNPGNTLSISGGISALNAANGIPVLVMPGGGAGLGTGGTINLSGINNTFNGEFLLSSYVTLGINSAANLPSGSNAGITMNNGTLAFTGDVTTSCFLTIGGTNSIDVSGSNTVVSFTGAYSNDDFDTLEKTGAGTLSILPQSVQVLDVLGLTVSEGTFIGNTFFFNNATDAISVTGTLEFYQTDAGTFTGTISGPGFVTVDGNGPLTMASTTNTYMGGTTLIGNLSISQDIQTSAAGVLGNASAPLMGSGGTLQTTASFSTSRPITLAYGTDTTFSTNANTVLGLTGSISGLGGLIKEGPGALLLTGVSGYSGITYVNEGVLIVNGSIASSGDPIVAANAMISGTGTIGSTEVYGTIKGGNPLGTLTVSGDLVLEEGSTFATVISSSSGPSLVNVSGSVTIDSNATYLVGISPGVYNEASPVVVLTGSSITGEFTTVNDLAAYFLFPNLTYTGTEVLLDFTTKSIEPLVSGQNAINVASSLDDAIFFNRTEVTYTIEPGNSSASPTPELVEILASLLPFSSSAEEMTYALNQLHPAQLKGMAIAQENNIVQVREALSQRMRNELDLANCELKRNTDKQEGSQCERNKKTMVAWANGIGESLGQDNKNNGWGPLTGYRANMGGLATGIDGVFAEHFYAGALGGYTHSHLNWKEGKGHGDINSGYAGLYLSALGKMFYGNASVIGSWSHYSADRHIAYGSVDKTAKNGHGGSQLLSHLDTGVNLNYLGLTIRPFDSFDYISQLENSYREHNAGEWDLSVKKNNAILMRNELGLQLAKCYCIWNSKWTLSPKISWIREVRVKGDQFVVNFAEGSSPFLIEGYFPDRSLFAPGLTMTGVMLKDTLAFDLYYNGEFGSGYSANNYGGQIRYSF